MIIKKKKLADCIKVRVEGVNNLFCPSEYYMITVKGIACGKPIDSREKAEIIVDWFNSVDYYSFEEDLKKE